MSVKREERGSVTSMCHHNQEVLLYVKMMIGRAGVEWSDTVGEGS
ncbi:hypothetical protein [Salinithrix halophila]|uniref:Uncharacterized protein n=1 Tax=Salinithrix halophila TaxID=1485204 RepID=A0ABV8JI16_9BACL